MAEQQQPQSDANEPVLDLESQLDDLLAQLKPTQPDTPETPELSKTADTPESPESSAAAFDDSDDLQGSFEAVPQTPPEAAAVDSQTASSAERTLAALDEAIANEQDVDTDAALEATSDATSDATPETAADADSQDEEEADTADDMMFSPDDFITPEQQEQVEASTTDEAEPQDDLGMELASEIQQLLDSDSDREAPKQPQEHRRPPASKPAAEPVSTAPAVAEVNAASDGDAAVASKDDDAAQRSDTAAASAASDDAADEEEESDVAQAAMSLEDIDQMLASEADDAVEGEFETPSQVMATEAAASENTAGQVNEDVAAATTYDDSSAAMAADDEMDFEGSFEATQDVIAQDEAQQSAQESDLTPAAAAVARELDEQPENDPARKNAKSSSIDKPVAASGGVMAAMLMTAYLPQLARKACMVINRPLASFAPQTRDMVGYAGLITLFWGSVTIAIKLVGAVTG